MNKHLSAVWTLIKTRKKVWLSPFLVVLFMLVLLAALSHGESVAPMIYSLF